MVVIAAALLFVLAQDTDLQDTNKLSLRARIIARYDEDGDGRLNAVEREVLRKSGEYRSVKERFRREKRQEFGPAMMKKYDEDQDGKLNDKEYAAAQKGLRAKWDELVRRYDVYPKDRLNLENLKKMESAARVDEIEEFPPELYGWIHFVREREKREGTKEPVHPLARFDKNDDGRLNAAELQEARAAIAKAAAERAEAARQSAGPSKTEPSDPKAE